MSRYLLPTFQGYVVDLRNHEFRRAIPDVGFEVIPFHAPKGKRLFRELNSFAQEVIELYDYR